MPDATGPSPKEAAEIEKLKAEAAKTTAETDKLRADADLARWKALVPDPAAVKGGSLTAPTDRTVSATLAFHAMAAAARDLAQRLEGVLGSRVLVTSHVDLASTAAVFLEVEAAIAAVARHAEAVIEADPRRARPPGKSFAPVPVIGAIAGALPAALSLFRVDRAVSTASFGPNDTAAAALVAGALAEAGREVVHDHFRLPERGGIWTRLADLADSRRSLLAALRGGGPGRGPTASRPDKATMALWTEEVKTAVAAIDALDARLRARPEGAARAPLVEASLHEALFAGGAGGGPAQALLVKSEGGQVAQATADRVIGADTVMLIAEVAITYMVLDLAENRLTAAGAAPGVAQASGRIGAPLRIEASAGTGAPTQAPTDDLTGALGHGGASRP